MPASDHDIVTIQNISNEDFEFFYDRASGNYPYTIRAGEVKRFPRFLASHCVKHLIDKILNDRNQKTDNEVFRQQLAEQIIIDEEVFQEVAAQSEADKTKNLVDRLNVPSELDGILKKRREQPKTAVSSVPEKPAEVIEEPEEFEGLKPKDEVSKVSEATPSTSVSAPATPPATVTTADVPVQDSPNNVIALPTRKELYAYAESSMHIQLNEKLTKRFDKMKINELIKELDYPLESLVKG